MDITTGLIRVCFMVVNVWQKNRSVACRPPSPDPSFPEMQACGMDQTVDAWNACLYGQGGGGMVLMFTSLLFPTDGQTVMR